MKHFAQGRLCAACYFFKHTSHRFTVLSRSTTGRTKRSVGKYSGAGNRKGRQHATLPYATALPPYSTPFRHWTQRTKITAMEAPTANPRNDNVIGRSELAITSSVSKSEKLFPVEL